MPPLPNDVRQALGLADEPCAWVRVRSSLGSIVGETFLLASGRAARIAMRSSALADLQELSQSEGPRLEESPNDAFIVWQRGGIDERIAVGYLERDDVRAFFAALSAPPTLAADQPTAAPEAPTFELTDLRVSLLGVLVARHHSLLRSATRSRLLGLLRARASQRREALTARAAAASRTPTAASLRRVTAAIDEVASSTTRRDNARPVAGDTRWTMRIGILIAAAAAGWLLWRSLLAAP